jgi:hypothetical protein
MKMRKAVVSILVIVSLITYAGCASKSPLPVVINQEIHIPDAVRYVEGESNMVDVSAVIKAVGGSVAAKEKEETLVVSVAGKTILITESQELAVDPQLKITGKIKWYGPDPYIDYNAFVLMFLAAFPRNSMELKKGQGLFISYQKA